VKVGSGSLQLSASSSQYISIPAFTTGSSGLSFACWFKSSGSGQWSHIFDFSNGPSSNNIYMGVNHINGLQLSVYNAGVQQSQILNAVSNINSGVWYHVVWTLDPSGTWILYLNGASFTQVTNYFYPQAISRATNYLGKSNWADPYFNGAIDEFRMYNRVLTSSDAQLVYLGVCAGTSSPTLTPSVVPTIAPTQVPTLPPTLTPSGVPTIAPTQAPTFSPTLTPSGVPTVAPTNDVGE
jgi:hypothetical protein